MKVQLPLDQAVHARNDAETQRGLAVAARDDAQYQRSIGLWQGLVRD